MTEIFISYSRRNKAFVERFLKALYENGYSPEMVWVDWDDIPASSKWEDEIKKGIEKANSIIFILSPDWAASNECAKELKFAAEYNKRLFPIVWQNVDPNTIQPELASLNWIFFREADDFNEALQKLFAALKTDLSWVAQHTDLLSRANEWNAKERDNGYLLRGSELQSAETWHSQASENKQPRPTPLQSEYILASRQEEVQRQRRTLIGVSVALVVSIALAIAAVISGISALRQSQKALASQLAAQSIALVDTQPDLSFLLSLEANYIGDELGETDYAWLGSLVTNLNSSPKLGTFLHGHKSDVRALAFSPDGRWLASAGGIPSGETGEVILWDLTSGTNQKLDTGATSRLLTVAFNTDSKTLVAAGDGKELLVWNTDKCCELIQEPIPVPDKVRAVKFVTVNGQEYLAAAAGNQVTFWDLANGQMQPNLTLQIQAVNDKTKILSLAFSPITHELAAGGEDGAVTVWDLDKHEEKFRVCSYGESAPISVSPCDDALNGETKEIRGLAFNSDASLLISGSSDKRAWLWDAQTGDLLAKTPDGNAGGHINTVTSVAFNPKDKRQVATVSWDNTVRLWNLVQDTNKTWSLSRVDTLAGHSNSIWATAFAPDGKQLASGSSDKSVILWKVSQVNQIGTPVAQMQGEVWALAVSPNGKQFAAGDDSGNIRIWKFDDKGKKLSDPVTLNHPDGVVTLAYSHDGKWLASAGYGQTIRVWDAQTLKEAWRVENAHTDEIWSLMFSPNDQLLASASFDKTAKLWNTTSHLPVATLEHNDEVWALTFDKTGTHLLVAGYEADTYLWDLTNTASIPSPKRLTGGHIYSVNSLAYNPKYPSLLASTSDDKTLLVWNVDSKKSTPPVLGLIESMEAVTFRPSGDWLASATDNNTILLWQLNQESCLKQWDVNGCQPNRLGAPLVGHQAPVENVVFLSDTAMISSSQDGQLILWNLDKSYWYKKACDIVKRPLGLAEKRQYIDGKLNTTLLAAADWFSNLFGSESPNMKPSCIE